MISPQRILVTRTDRLGDLVLTTPVFEALRSRFPKAHLACLTFLENRAVVEGNPYLNEVILYDKRGSEKGWFGNIRFAFKLARKRFDTIVHLHPTNRMHWVGWLARIPNRIGYQKKNAWALTQTLEDKKGEGLKHESEYNFDLLKFLEVEIPQKMTLHFPLKEKDRVSLGLLLKNLDLKPEKPYVVLNPSASCPSKLWPAGRFARLADQIQDQYAAQIVLIGTSADRHFAKKVKEYACAFHSPPSPLSSPPGRGRGEGEGVERVSGEGLFDLSGKLSLGMLAWLLKDARLLISNDSGPVHVASAVGTPVVSIFGRNLAGLSPRRWGPLGEGGRVVHHEVSCPVCLAHNCKINFLCLDVISVEDVLKEAENFL